MRQVLALCAFHFFTLPKCNMEPQRVQIHYDFFFQIHFFVPGSMWNFYGVLLSIFGQILDGHPLNHCHSRIPTEWRRATGNHGQADLPPGPWQGLVADAVFFGHTHPIYRKWLMFYVFFAQGSPNNLSLEGVLWVQSFLGDVHARCLESDRLRGS